MISEKAQRWLWVEEQDLAEARREYLATTPCPSCEEFRLEARTIIGWVCEACGLDSATNTFRKGAA